MHTLTITLSLSLSLRVRVRVSVMLVRIGDADKRDQVLRLVLSLVLEPRLQPMFANAAIQSRLQPLASALLQVRSRGMSHRGSATVVGEVVELETDTFPSSSVVVWLARSSREPTC
jgi:hypothetical protein